MRTAGNADPFGRAYTDEITNVRNFRYQQARERRREERQAREAVERSNRKILLVSCGIVFAAGLVMSLMLRLGGSMAMSALYGVLLGALLVTILVVASSALEQYGALSNEDAVDDFSDDDLGGMHMDMGAHHSRSRMASTQDDFGPEQDMLMFQVVSSLAKDTDKGDIYLDENGKVEEAPAGRGWLVRQ